VLSFHYAAPPDEGAYYSLDERVAAALQIARSFTRVDP
jgi:hypothetical protein